MAYTDFFCDPSTGSNMNGGSSAGAATATYTNGNWSTATNVFTPASGDPQADGVAVGDFVSIYNDGATTPVFIARVTAVTTTTFTVSTTARGGTPPTTSATGRTATVAGAWLGPNGAVSFPIGFNLASCTNASGDPVRVNLKNSASYAVTAAMTANVNAITFQGYTTTVGDLGKAVIDGGTSGASYIVLSTTTQPAVFIDLLFQNNGATGSADGVSCGVSGTFLRCVFTGMRGSGLNAANVVSVIECEAYANNASNTANKGGFAMTTSSNPQFIRCLSHDNTGSNNNGFVLQGNNAVVPTCISCVADTNGLHGFFCNNAAQGKYRFNGCTAYNNGGDGIRFVNANHYYVVENTLLVSNTGYGVNQAATPTSFPQLVTNCGFFGNGSGETNGINASWVTGKVSFSSAPLADPGNGNFSIASAAGQGTGRGSFQQTSGHTATTVSYPDIGAVQAAGGQASAAFIGRSQLGRRDYRPQVTRHSYRFVPGSSTTTTVHVPLRIDNPRARGRGQQTVRVPAPRLIPVPAGIQYVPVPLPIQRVRHSVTPSRPAQRQLVPVVTVQQTAVPVAPQVRHHVRHMRILRREPTVIILPAPQTVVVSHPRVVR